MREAAKKTTLKTLTYNSGESVKITCLRFDKIFFLTNFNHPNFASAIANRHAGLIGFLAEKISGKWWLMQSIQGPALINEAEIAQDTIKIKLHVGKKSVKPPKPAEFWLEYENGFKVKIGPLTATPIGDDTAEQIFLDAAKKMALALNCQVAEIIREK